MKKVIDGRHVMQQPDQDQPTWPFTGGVKLFLERCNSEDERNRARLEAYYKGDNR